MKFNKDFGFFILILVALVAIVAIVSIVFLVLNSQDSPSIISDDATIIDNCVIETNSSITGKAVVSCPSFDVIGGTVVRR